MRVSIATGEVNACGEIYLTASHDVVQERVQLHDLLDEYKGSHIGIVILA